MNRTPKHDSPSGVIGSVIPTDRRQMAEVFTEFGFLVDNGYTVHWYTSKTQFGIEFELNDTIVRVDVATDDALFCSMHTQKKPKQLKIRETPETLVAKNAIFAILDSTRLSQVEFTKLLFGGSLNSLLRCRAVEFARQLKAYLNIN